MSRRNRVKPIQVAGHLVTPVTGEPAAPRNWAPPCPACQVRLCAACGAASDHRAEACACGGTLGDPQHCPQTTVRSTQGGLQYCKCGRCGHSWKTARVNV